MTDQTPEPTSESETAAILADPDAMAAIQEAQDEALKADGDDVAAGDEAAEEIVTDALDEESDRQAEPWINNGAVVTIQLLSQDFVGDPVEAAEQIMLDLIMHGLHRRGVVVTDMGDGEEYIIKDGRVVSPDEVAAAQAAVQAQQD